MNTPNNKRKKESIERIEKVFISLLQTNELNEITRGFNSNDYLKLFCHIKDNQIFYKTYFKLGYDDSYKIITYDINLARQHFDNRFIEYHMEFFKSGITKIIKLWLQNGCKESPEDMYEIIKSEYQGRADSGKECSDTL